MQDAGTVQVTVSGKNVQVTPALRSHAERKVNKLLKFVDDDRRPMMASVVLSIERGRHTAEITFEIGTPTKIIDNETLQTGSQGSINHGHVG